MPKRTIRTLLTELEARGTRFDKDALKQNLCPTCRAGWTEQQRLAKQQMMFDNLMASVQGGRLMTLWSRMDNLRWTSRPNVMIFNNHGKIFLPDPGTHLMDAQLVRCEIDLALQMAGEEELARSSDVHKEIADITGLDRQTAKLSTYKLLYGMKRDADIQKVADALPDLEDFIHMVNSSHVILSPAGTPIRVPEGKSGNLMNRYLQASVSEIVDRWLEAINQDIALLMPDGALLQVPDGQQTQFGMALIDAFQGLDLPEQFGLTVDLTECATGDSFRARFARH
jgi:hypothetical protein